MADNRLKEKDYTAESEALVAETESLVQAQPDQLDAALERLLLLEKQTRQAADLASTTRILVHICRLCKQAGQWSKLNEMVTLLAKKHGQLKQAITRMVQEAMSYLSELTDAAAHMALITTLRVVTEGKIYVEVERARLTRMLAKIKEDEGDLEKAADILQELQVETFGSMERREKTDFILEQMRLCLAKHDYVRTQIISRKINTRFFSDPANQDLKLRYYDLMIRHALHEGQHLEVCKYYRQVYDTPSIKEDEARWKEVLQNTVLFAVLAPYDNEQSDLLHRIYEDAALAKLPYYHSLVKNFITDEIMRWPRIEEYYGSTLQQTSMFGAEVDGGEKRWKDLHHRIVEHNIRVVAKYYTRITMVRLAQLLDLDHDEAEEFLCRLVVSKTVHARIDRPAGIITFAASRDPVQILNDWSRDVDRLMDIVEKTTHLINKEEMVHRITRAV
ncbi:26S proteasome non-ATPase regulatory subunit 12 [Syncephalis pseudoplumigaleata]|uniref:26S proteasome non-ATPase regulatory subunit 12 n=1 Tax=Syncephalis pseudoplumigaleata TaxID=1712513 RepID=A0A4P9YQX0_9FUNG|nr:26S proteasome non-ATPase regulatory subunit 12 [Syncephalis pseudoplumigaleata]|eukprot:RKP22223.1 26S proteasome non-ATPase regulatory subunit 12 [Syncephalis pseudoplumigaleata]